MEWEKPASQTEEAEMKNAIIFIIALAVSGIALAESHAQIHGKYAAPFGLEWGLSEEQVTAMGVKLTSYGSALGSPTEYYYTRNLPKNLSDFNFYELHFHTRFGLIEVDANTKGYPDALQARERYNQLKTALVNKYGKPFVLGNSEHSAILHWGSDIDGTIKLERVNTHIYLTYQSATEYIAAEREFQKKKEQTVPDEDAL